MSQFILRLHLRPAFLVLFGLLLGFGSKTSAQEVNVLCSPALPWCEAIAQAFEEATGIKLNFVRLSSGEALARIRAEKENPTFDVWFGGTGDPHLVAFQEGLTEFYKPSIWESLRPELREQIGERYIPLYLGVLGFGVNESVLAERGAPIPRCWKDLADPVYKGLIAMPNPNTSGTAYTTLATLVQIFGEEEAFDLLKQIHQNVAQYTRSGGAPGLLAGRGDVGIAVQFLHDVIGHIKSGFTLTTVVPCEGTGFEIGGLSLIKGAPNREAAIQFIEWALTPEAQALAATANSFQLPSNTNSPVPPESPRPEEVKLIDYDFATFGSPEVRDRLVERWNNEVFPLPR
ncbi:extracellular solute-binding protein family 1 [Marinithermus hydrothermalis DSM 14884]|uniref:Extracellular solute-binding protein family 1 n=1 Tax=Marinithermus hydrothermalis (strain DSM 14884 / JCM 11576 / T1) TaxID=869210 RepID=F2NR96_MARHT|nr:extracellular solute-binding protein family 1 [Marinithermus hydrothermalis DSM 14884]